MKQKPFKHLLSFKYFGLLSAVVISGCSSSTTTPNTPTYVSPKTGSSYNYSMYKTDSSGTKVPSSDTTFTENVVADGQVLLGKSNVFTTVDRGDTTNFTYALNNDIMVYYQSTGLTGVFQSVGDIVFHRWITLGTTSKAVGVVIFDSSLTITVSGFPVPAKVHVVSDYITDENITVGTETLTAHHCRITSSATSNTALITPAVTYTNQRDIYFVDKIGYAAKVTTHEFIPAITLLSTKASASGSFKVLTSYTLK